MKTSFVAIALAACIAAGTAAAAPAPAPDSTLAVTMGDQRITVPMPEGLVAPEGPAVAVTDMLRDSLPANYRLVALRVPQSYVDGLRARDPATSMARYCTILSYRKYETSGMTPAMFEAVRKALREQGDKVLKAADTLAASSAERMGQELAKRTGDASTSLKIGTSTSLGLVEEHPDSLVLATIGPVSITSKAVNESGQQVTVMVIARVHGKPINANFYADYHSKDDLVWAEVQAREWLRRLDALNP